VTFELLPKCGIKRNFAGLLYKSSAASAAVFQTNEQKADTNYLIDQQRIEV
jgi:hypothetical protein